MRKKLTQEEFVSRVLRVHAGYTVLGKYLGSNHKVDIKCDKGHIWDAYPSHLVNGIGCPYCAGKRVVIGETDLWTQRPDVAILLKDQNVGRKYGCGSHHQALFTCPDCGRESVKEIRKVCERGFSCPFCSDGISYPNKFGRALLSQLPIENHICEYHPDWAKPYFYDNYFVYNAIEYILEMDGEQHYTERTQFKKSLEEVQQNDKIKTDLANQHNIKIIRIDCIESDCGYIRNNILESEMNNIFDLSKIDWQLCDESAHKNLIKEICALYASGEHSTLKLARRFHIHKATVIRYLKTGVQYGWCSYDPKQAAIDMYNRIKMPVKIINDSDNTVQVFESIRSCAKKMQELYNIYVTPTSIGRACRSYKPYKGFNFRFANETIQN